MNIIFYKYLVILILNFYNNIKKALKTKNI